MTKDEKEINVHIMHSMKGGCGKSTCALFKTLQIAHEQGIGDKCAHVLFMDADFKGSAMTEILFHRRHSSDEGQVLPEEWEKVQKLQELGGRVMKGRGMQHKMAIPDNFDSYITLSDYLKDSSQCSIDDVICRSCSYETEEKAQTTSGSEDAEIENTADLKQKDFVNGYVDFILSSASSKSKNWFRHKQGKIAAGVYSYRMDILLRNILNREVVNAEHRGIYSDIVIDMPPGYDEYSDILLDLLRDIAEKNENLKLHYYAITTEDIGHKALTKDNVQRIISDKTKCKPFFSVNLVLSAVSSTDFLRLNGDERKIYQSWIEVDGNPNGKTYVNEYSESYHQFCRNGNIGKFEQDIKKVLK